MSSEEKEETLVYIVFIIVLLTFTLVGGWMESKHPKIGHETGFIILFGMLISYLATVIEREEDKHFVFQFNTKIFFDLALPSILFAAGYNMRRKQFFENFVNIVKFGIFGSLFTYVFFVGLTKLLFVTVDMKMYDPEAFDGEGGVIDFHLTTLEIMVVCSILVSSDIIAAMSILKFDEQPHIFSIILGEGLFNDVVVLVLYQTVSLFQEDPTAVFDTSMAFKIIGDFILLCVLSVLIGCLIGFTLTYILKKARYVSHSAIQETFVMIVTAMFSYYISEIAG